MIIFDLDIQDKLLSPVMNVEEVSVILMMDFHLIYLLLFLPAFSSKSHLKSHKKSHKPSVLIACQLCPKKVVDIRKHMKWHTGYTNRCEFRLEDNTECGLLFRSKSRLNEHIDIAHKNLRKWLCKYCESAFARSNQLNIHIRAVHLKFQVDCIVPGCKTKFTSKKSLAAHIKIVHRNLTKEERNEILEKARKIPLPKIE